MKTFTLLLVSILAVFAVRAYSMPSLTEVQGQLNASAMNGPGMLLGTQLVQNKVQLLKCKYDYASQGGAVGTINLKAVDGTPCKIPAKAMVIDGMVEVLTTPVSASGATVSLGLISAADLMAATNSSSVTGRLAIIPVGTVATLVKNSSSSSKVPTMEINTNSLSAGKLNVFLQYLLGD